MEALLQPRANFKFLAKYFQGAYYLSFQLEHLSLYILCRVINPCSLWLIERDGRNYGLGFFGRNGPPGPPGPKGMLTQRL